VRVAAATVSSAPDSQETTQRILIEDHRLQPFNPTCFTGPRASFDAGHLEIARAFREQQAVAAPFQVGASEPPVDIRSLDLELDGLVRILKDPWSAWLQSLGVVLPRAAEDPFALDRDPVAAPSGLELWQLQDEVIQSVLEGQTFHLEACLAANRLMPYGTLGAAMGRNSVQVARSLAERALQETGGTLQPCRLVYHDGRSQVAGNICVNADDSLQVLVRPTTLKDKPQHRLDVWVRATFAAACGMACDTLLISRDGDRVTLRRIPAIAQAQARAWLENLLHLCEQARRHPLPFGPKTSHAIFQAGRHDRAERDAAIKAWERQHNGPPGEGDSASAQLAWRDQDPFAEGTFGEWRRLAVAVFEPVDNWFVNTTATANGEVSGG
jgi:exodeoxyribonuclease V gamma subunit